MDEVFVGKLVNTRGLKGEVKVISNFERPDDVFKVGNYVYINNRGYVINHVSKVKNFILLQFNGINDINEIEFLKGSDIYALRKNIIDDSEDYLYSDLIGFKVKCKNQDAGEITDFINNEVNPLLEATRNGKKYFIPVNSNMIDKVSIEEETVTLIDIGEGLYLWK